MKKQFIILMTTLFLLLVAGCTRTDSENLLCEEPTISTTSIPDEEPETPIQENKLITAYANTHEVVTSEQIIEGKWIAVGNPPNPSITIDYTKPHRGKPSFYFELTEGNRKPNKVRAELALNYATIEDFNGYPEGTYEKAQLLKTTSDYGKRGIIPQNCTSRHIFSVYFPEDLPLDAQVIFAQILGMQNHTAVIDPTRNNERRRLTEEEFLSVLEHTYFGNGIGYGKIYRTDKNGKDALDLPATLKNPNGWYTDISGGPSLTLGLGKGVVYIQCRSAREWIIGEKDYLTESNYLNTNEKEASNPNTIVRVYESSIKSFPKERWVTFDLTIVWSRFDGMGEHITPGKINATISYEDNGKNITEHIVRNRDIYIGRNNERGYHFKFGIYCPSEVPAIRYNLAGYYEEINPQ